ncbi:uncharacterized protein [Rutidosis leptorrhynchoides]|uniref:uncharacterized protein n=1 Tax=Rutidosis leptorrhynchoides TaxID=125765 RepID=UPI003A9A6614
MNGAFHICRQGNPDSMYTLFGGKIVVFGGDFRQILPVIQKGTREDIVAASLNSSYMWDYVTVLKLTVNMRLCDVDDPIGSIISTIYLDYLLNVGNPEYYQQREIFSPTHEVVTTINDRMMMCLEGKERSYLSLDSICASQRDADFNNELYTTDFLNSIEVGGLSTI